MDEINWEEYAITPEEEDAITREEAAARLDAISQQISGLYIALQALNNKAAQHSGAEFAADPTQMEALCSIVEFFQCHEADWHGKVSPVRIREEETFAGVEAHFRVMDFSPQEFARFAELLRKARASFEVEYIQGELRVCVSVPGVFVPKFKR